MFVLLYKEIEAALMINSVYSKQVLMSSENIKVSRPPQQRSTCRAVGWMGSVRRSMMDNGSGDDDECGGGVASGDDSGGNDGVGGDYSGDHKSGESSSDDDDISDNDGVGGGDESCEGLQWMFCGVTGA